MPRVTLVCSMWHHFTSCLTSASRMPKCNLCLWVAHTTIYRSIWSTHAHMSHRVCRTASVFMISSYPSLPHTTKVSRMYTVMIWICVVMACDPYFIPFFIFQYTLLRVALHICNASNWEVELCLHTFYLQRCRQMSSLLCCCLSCPTSSQPAMTVCIMLDKI